MKKLIELERDRGAGKSKQYDDLISFFYAFYSEWGSHYSAFMPKATLADRQKLREETFASSNIMFFPMFRLAFEIWEKYQQEKIDWRKSSEWKTGLAKLAGTIAKNGKKIGVMSRENSDWHGKILIETFNKKTGKPTGWSLSSTRQTRDAAYAYLKDLFG